MTPRPFPVHAMHAMRALLASLLPTMALSMALAGATAGAAERTADPALSSPAIDGPIVDAQAPPAPPLAPVQAYRPLNFYSREELAAFPPAQVPKIAPWCSGAYVAPPLPPLPGDGAGVNASVYVAADTMQLDENGESQVAGRVEVRQDQNMMRADRAVISAGRDQLLLEGNVYLQDPAMTLEAARAELTLDGSGSHIRDTRYALHAAHIRGSASAINRDNLYQVDVLDGAYTTCEPGSAAWMLESRRIHLDQEAGWGSASHVRLLIEQVPLLYIPYITFPIDQRRRTGVLYPTFNFSGSNGTDIAVPYYLNLDPQYDLLLVPRWIEERGGMVEAELRYLHGAPKDSVGEGSLGVGHIASDAAYNDDERYVLRYRHSGAPAEGWNLFADATEVSDNDYLDDLDTRLSVNRDAHLLRIVQMRYADDRWAGLARVQAYQTINPTIAPADQPYRRLPQLLASTRQAGSFGSEWSALGEYTAFERDTAVLDPVGSRLRFEPALARPLYGDSYRILPVAKLRHASYTLTDNPTGDTLERTIPTASLDATLFLDRAFRFAKADWTQTLEPRLYALWTPYEEQDDIPLFDTTELTFGYEQLFRDNRFIGGDRVGDARQVSLALESALIGPDGSESARIGFGQTFHDADRRVQLTPATPVETNDYSPFVAHALWRVSNRWSLRSEGQWSPVDREFVRGSLRGNWQDEAFRTANIAYRYDQPGINQLELSGLLPVGSHWTLVGRSVSDIESSRSLEALGGFEYESCCWRARVMARRTLDIQTGSARLVPEEGIVFEIELKGLGSLGEQISSELAETIPGYETRRQALP